MPALCHRHSYVDDIARYVSAVQLNRYLVVGVGCSTVDHYEIKLFHTMYIRTSFITATISDEYTYPASSRYIIM